MNTWCANIATDGARPQPVPVREAAWNVRTRCKHFVAAPGGYKEREPTCPECLAALRKTRKRKAAAKT